GINSHICENIVEASYSFSDGETNSYEDNTAQRSLNYRVWARYGVFYPWPTTDLRRKYYVEFIGLYRLWISIYLGRQRPSSVMLVYFIYECPTLKEDLPSLERCDDSDAILVWFSKHIFQTNAERGH
uniref:Uncharacterized protein n=1 Tax=Macaca fascicularis TaxID=9541 RepID=A0A7N9I988_MACFA